MAAVKAAVATSTCARRSACKVQVMSLREPCPIQLVLLVCDLCPGDVVDPFAKNMCVSRPVGHQSQLVMQRSEQIRRPHSRAVPAMLLVKKTSLRLWIALSLRAMGQAGWPAGVVWCACCLFVVSLRYLLFVAVGLLVFACHSVLCCARSKRSAFAQAKSIQLHVAQLHVALRSQTAYDLREGNAQDEFA